MGVYVPDSVINSELQETVSRESIRRIIQGQTCVATSETQAQILLNNAAAAGVDTVGFSIIRTDIGMSMFWDGSSWVRTGGGHLDYAEPSYPSSYASAANDTTKRVFAITNFTLPAKSDVHINFGMQIRPTGNSAGSISVNVDGVEVGKRLYHSQSSTNHQFPLIDANTYLSSGKHEVIGYFQASTGSVVATFERQQINVGFA